jgi:hypothetical protein
VLRHQADAASRCGDEEDAMDHDKSGYKVVYTIVERRNKDQKPFWLRIGAAFINRDGSWNVHLDAVPTNGKLHIRDPRSAEERAGLGGGFAAGNGGGNGNGHGNGNGRGPEDVPEDVFSS